MEMTWVQDRRGQGQTRSSPDLLQVGTSSERSPRRTAAPEALLSLGMGGALDLCASLPSTDPTRVQSLLSPFCVQNPSIPTSWAGSASVGPAGAQGGDHRRGSRIPSISLVSALLLCIAGSPALACHSRAHQRLSLILTTFVFICSKLLMLPSYPMPDTGLWHQGPQPAQLEPV